MYIDIRHAILLAINILKYGVGMSWDWDPYNTISNLTWIKAIVHIILFVVFPFISIKVHVPLTTHAITRTTSTGVLKQLEELSAPLAVTLVAAVLILPQAIFWYAYLIIILIPSCLCVLNRFANWLHIVLITIPVLNVVLRATTLRWQGAVGPEPDHNEASAGDTQGVEMRLGEDHEAGRVPV